MSGSSYSTDCPRCGGKDTMNCQTDHRPFDGVSGECLRCGFEYWTDMGIMDAKELGARRVDYDCSTEELAKFGQIPDDDKQNIEKFDTNYGIKTEK